MWNCFRFLKSYSILPVRLQCIMKKALFLRFFSYTYLITVSLENEIIVLEKVWEKSWILDLNICTSPVFSTGMYSSWPHPNIQLFLIKTYHHPKSDNNCINSHRLQCLLFAFFRRCTTWGFDSDRSNYIWPFRHVRPGGLLQTWSLLCSILKVLIQLYAAIGRLHDDIILLLRSEFFRVLLFLCKLGPSHWNYQN